MLASERIAAETEEAGPSSSMSPPRKRKSSSEAQESSSSLRDDSALARTLAVLSPGRDVAPGGAEPRSEQQPVHETPTEASCFPGVPTAISDQARRQVANTAASVSLEKLGFSWAQTETDVKIYLPLTTATTEQLNTTFTPRSAHFWAEVDSQRFFFELRRLYAPIEPEHCLARVPKSRKHVLLKLRKAQPDVEWPLLRKLDDPLI